MLSSKARRGTAVAAALVGVIMVSLLVSGAGGSAATARRYPACGTSQLLLWWGMPGSGVAGGVYYELELSNVSATTCTLFGFPGVSAVNGRGRQVGAAAARDRTFAPTDVVLPPGATGHAVLRVSDVDVFPPSVCRPVTATGLRIYPPNQSSAAFLPLRLRACTTSGPVFLSVRVVRPHAGVPGYSQ